MTGVRVRQREQTRQALIQEARTLFAQRGYGAVGLAEIVAAAGVTKGPLPQLRRQDRPVPRGPRAGPVGGRRPGGHVGVRRRGLLGLLRRRVPGVPVGVERPRAVPDHADRRAAVLGWAEWRRLDEQTSARHLAESLQQLVDDGVIAAQPVEPLTRLLSGAMNEAALWLAEARGRWTARPSGQRSTACSARSADVGPLTGVSAGSPAPGSRGLSVGMPSARPGSPPAMTHDRRSCGSGSALDPSGAGVRPTGRAGRDPVCHVIARRAVVRRPYRGTGPRAVRGFRFLADVRDHLFSSTWTPDGASPGIGPLSESVRLCRERDVTAPRDRFREDRGRARTSPEQGCEKEVLCDGS